MTYLISTSASAQVACEAMEVVMKHFNDNRPIVHGMPIKTYQKDSISNETIVTFLEDTVSNPEHSYHFDISRTLFETSVSSYTNGWISNQLLDTTFNSTNVIQHFFQPEYCQFDSNLSISVKDSMPGYGEPWEIYIIFSNILSSDFKSLILTCRITVYDLYQFAYIFYMAEKDGELVITSYTSIIL